MEITVLTIEERKNMISFRSHAGIWKNCYEGSDWKGRVSEGTMKKLGSFSGFAADDERLPDRHGGVWRHDP